MGTNHSNQVDDSADHDRRRIFIDMIRWQLADAIGGVDALPTAELEVLAEQLDAILPSADRPSADLPTETITARGRRLRAALETLVATYRFGREVVP